MKTFYFVDFIIELVEDWLNFYPTPMKGHWIESTQEDAS